MTATVAAEPRDDVAAALAWAAGAPGQLPSGLELSEPDEERLLRLVDAHGLAARFGARLDRHDTMFGARVRASARDLQSDVRRRVREHAGAVDELATATGGDRGLIVLKGMAAYQATGRHELMRCGDVDVLTRPGLPIEAALLELGYRRTRQAFMHERGEFTRGTTEIDLHEHFPIYRYSDDLRNADLRPHSHPGTWRQEGGLEALPVSYASALDGARVGRPLEAPAVQVPCPELQVILLCAHGFMNYTNLWSISHREKPYVRLAELADVRDLVGNPGFDCARLAALVDKLGARDAVEWAATAGRELLGSSPLPAAATPAASLDGGRFPRCLWWRFWAELPVDADTLADRSWLSMDRVLDVLGAAELHWNGGRTATYSTSEAAGATPLTRMLTLPNAEVVPFSVELDRSPSGLTVHVRIPSVGGIGIERVRVRVDLGHSAAEWIHTPGDVQPDTIGDADASMRTVGASCEVTLEFPVRDAGDVALLVGVTRTASDGTVAASTLVPARVNDHGGRA